jgi:hypothetical protein
MGYGVGLEFKIEGHKKDVLIVEEIKVFFKNKGFITIYGNYAIYCITSVHDALEVIIPHFDIFSLRTAKYADYLLFRRGVLNIKAGRHLIPNGLQEIGNIRATLN